MISRFGLDDPLCDVITFVNGKCNTVTRKILEMTSKGEQHDAAAMALSLWPA
jgi:ABC-type Fe3+ transport system permease subunit